MSAAENKQLMQRVFAELAAGNSRPFIDSFADDVRWTIVGRTNMWVTNVTDPDGYNLSFESVTDAPEETEYAEETV